METSPIITRDERAAAAALLARCRGAGLSFTDQVVVQRDVATGRLSVESGGRVYQQLAGGRLIAARRRADGGLDLADLDGPHPRAFRRVFT